MAGKFLAFIVFLGALVVGYIYVFPQKATSDEPRTIIIDVPSGYNHTALAYHVGPKLGWDHNDEERFIEALSGIGWDSFNHELLPFLTNKLKWDDIEKEAFLVQGARLMRPPYNILNNFYVPGIYEVTSTDSPAVVASIFIDRIQRDYPNRDAFFLRTLSYEKLKEIDSFIRGEVELLPDLVALPPQDVGLKNKDGRDMLVFSTTYYNVGDGVLELVADPETKDIEDDVDRIVNQRVYKIDGTHRDHEVGSFLWHQEHLHYHYTDFVNYILTGEDVRTESADHVHDDSHSHAKAQHQEQKSTFCLRDVTHIKEPAFENNEAHYLSCDKERQGVSVGWGETYFFTYAGQELDVTDLPTGAYTLLFDVNPEKILSEENFENNISYAILHLDKENKNVEVETIYPEVLPEYEHVHKNQVLK